MVSEEERESLSSTLDDWSHDKLPSFIPHLNQLLYTNCSFPLSSPLSLLFIGNIYLFN